MWIEPFVVYTSFHIQGVSSLPSLALCLNLSWYCQFLSPLKRQRRIRWDSKGAEADPFS